MREFFIIIGVVSSPLGLTAIAFPKWAYSYYRRISGGNLFTWEGEGKGPRLVRVIGFILFVEGVTFLSIGLWADIP
jgi:hypothetical protein